MIAHTLQEFTELLQSLLPPGVAWTRRSDANLTKLLEAFATELVLLDQLLASLEDEGDPRTTQALLTEWETMLGLPDDCSDDLASSGERRNYVFVKYKNNPGGASIAYFLQLANDLGYPDIVILETAAHEWTVYGTEYNEHWFACGSGRMGDRLCQRGDDFLYCLFNMLQPAHTRVEFESHP